MSKAYDGKAAIVTGASSGLGRVIAQSLGAAGMELWLVGRSASELEVTAAAIRAQGGPPAHCQTMDLAQRGALAELVTQVGRQHPYLFALINNAGVMYPEPILGADPQRWHEMFAINLLTPMEACRAAVGAMRAHKLPAHLLNISSTAGRDDLYGAYSVSKSALNHVGRILRRELEQDDIRVTTISPGGFATNLIRGFTPQMVEKVVEASTRIGFDPSAPDARKAMGDPENVAKMVRYVLDQPIELNLEEITIRPAIAMDLY
jgi:NADP-dependent 3-hydroxy acid dehydrogenase YdfG